ncbi:IPT/TIG domain-containing protein [Hymenobacter sp. DG25A]|uniref:DUF7619 domain-containing protein n=1 Tax=Hymenobacter sp. DG25A TaxID=1385663 RepID=UPI0006BCF9D6|nr:IPT/TIG domain-containing protein [Hymenobacter sp. DG25A]ALD21537.1 hypothetical protein AM218_10365 [Hymenobacter sp. DG25A]
MNKFLPLFLLLIIFFSDSCLAQVPAFQLDKRVGVPIDFPYDIGVDGQDNIYIMEFDHITKLNSEGQYLLTIPKTRPGSFGVDRAGNVYVSTSYTYADSISQYDSKGKLVAKYSADPDTTLYRELQVLAVDQQGVTYTFDSYYLLQKVANTGQVVYSRQIGEYGRGVVAGAIDEAGFFYAFCEDYSVLKLNKQGQVEDTINLQAVYKDDITHGLIDKNGTIYISTLRHNKIEKFNQQGQYIGDLGEKIITETKSAMALDSKGNFLITSPAHQVNSSSILKVNPEGELLARWGHLTAYSDVAQDEFGNFYIFDYLSLKLLKYSATGEKLLEIGAGKFARGVRAIKIDLLGNIYTLSGYAGFNSKYDYFIQKFDSEGNYLTSYTPPNIGGDDIYTDFAVDAMGNLYLADYYGGCVRKINPNGLLVASIGKWGKGKGEVWIPLAVAVDIRGNVYVADYEGQRIQKFTAGGKLVRAFGAETTSEDFSPSQGAVVGLAVDGLGNVYINGNRGENGLRVYGSNSETATTVVGSYTDRLTINAQGSHLVAIPTGSDLIYIYNSNATKVDTLNLITGRIYQDNNANCLRDNEELPLPGMIVMAGNYYGVSDANGRYRIAVDTGTYVVKQLQANQDIGRIITPTCIVNQAVKVTKQQQTAVGPDFGNQVTLSPYLSVNITSNRRRRCFRNVTTVSYSNRGYSVSEPAFVTVALPPQVAFISASLPYERNEAGQYVFAVGSLKPGQQDNIIIQDSVVCGDESIRGLTVCTKAWITPPNVTSTTGGVRPASLTVEGRAEGNKQARFVVRNVGQEATADSLGLRVFSNTKLALQHNISLPAGDSLVLRIPSTTAVVRVETDQPAKYSGPKIASATLELSELRTMGQPSPAMAAFPPDVNTAEVKEDCQAIVDSYDPNDKLVIPGGITDQYYTTRKAPLRYRIRFQNTGNDVAYQVRVVDSLSANLDISTLQLEGASHPYRFELHGKEQPVLTFNFDDIQLPDSSRNMAASQGFIQFSIWPKEGLVDKTLVENYADIYFDYNSAVRTNYTFNRIYDIPATLNTTLHFDDVVATPKIVGISPAQGAIGATITITGRQFANVMANNLISFNGVQATSLSLKADTIRVKVPTGATSGHIQLTTPDGHTQSLSEFIVFQKPTITAVSPNESVPGSTVTLSGTHFSAIAEQDTVLFNGVAATVLQATINSLKVKVPEGAQSGKITLQTWGGKAESAEAFKVWYPPTVISSSLYKAKANTVLTLTGTNFSETPARNIVSLGGIQTPVLQSSSSGLQLRVPGTALSGKIEVKTPGGQAAAATDFTFLPAPNILGFSPAEGIIGTEVTITGTNLGVDEQQDTLLLNGVSVKVMQATASTMVFKIPKGTHSGTLMVAGIGGRATSLKEFRVVDLPDEDAVTVSPNPSHGVVTVDWAKANFEVQAIQIYSALGSLVSSIEIPTTSPAHTTLSFTNYSPGLYLVIIQSDHGRLIKRLLVL